MTETKPSNKPLIILFFLRLVSAFAFVGMYGSLLLLLENDYGYKPADAANLTGLFIGMNFIVQLIGGRIGDKYISFSKLFVIGNLYQAAGALMLAWVGGTYLHLGLSFFLLESMACTVSLNMFVNWMHGGDSHKRKVAYYWNYCGVNGGAFVGYLVAGHAETIHNYTMFFYISVFTSLLSILMARKLYQLLKDKLTFDLNRKISRYDSYQSSVVFLGLCSLPITAVLMSGSAIKGILLLAALVLIGVKLSVDIRETSSTDQRAKYIKYAVFCGYSITFWAIYMLIPTFIFTFIKYSVNTNVFGYELSPQWVENIGPLIIIIGTPLTAIAIQKLKSNFNIEVSPERHLVTGIICVTTSMLVLACGMYLTHDGSAMPISFLLLALSFIYIGELISAPAGQSIVGELIPHTKQGFYMGAWSLLVGLGVLISSYLSETILMPIVDANKTSLELSHYWAPFADIGVVSLVIMAVCIGVSRYTKRVNLIQNNI